MPSLHDDKNVVVPEDNASNDIIFLGKKYHYAFVIKGRDISKNSGDPIPKNTSFDKSQVIHVIY